MRLTCLYVLFVVLGGCATKASERLLLSGETLLIQGNISEATAVEFKRLLNQGRVSRVLLDSGGGMVEPALAIASEIRDRRLDVEVVGRCFSSCANYLFPAGATKTISGLGVVAWHGNMSHLLHMHATGEKPIDEKNLAYVQRRAKLENDFFASIGVDQFVCWIGKIDPYNARNMYFLDAADMARFGIADVKVRSGYERTDVSSYNADGIVNLQYIRVDGSKTHPPIQAK